MAEFLVFGTHCLCSHEFESPKGLFLFVFLGFSLADVTPYKHPADLNLLLFALGVSVLCTVHKIDPYSRVSYRGGGNGDIPPSLNPPPQISDQLFTKQ